MLYLAKGKNTYQHIKGVNVWYYSNNKQKLVDKGLNNIQVFNSNNDLFSSIHKSRLNVINL